MLTTDNIVRSERIEHAEPRSRNLWFTLSPHFVTTWYVLLTLMLLVQVMLTLLVLLILMLTLHITWNKLGCPSGLRGRG